jgi:hypothetical protein
MKRWTLFFLAVCFFSSCEEEKYESIRREDLFKLDIGVLEDQVNLFDLEGDRSIKKTRIAMREGLFYIADGNGGKVMRYNSFGDLLFMIYNEETNPAPLTLKTSTGDSALVTRWAFTYPLREPGEIAVDSRKHIYVEDRLPQERFSFDSDINALLDSTVLHFDNEGRFIEYLGQEGVGGSPFPMITGVFSSLDDNLAVVCHIPAGWNIYWFNGNGALLYLVHISNKELPVPQGKEALPSLDSISVAPDASEIYLKIDYSRDLVDESTKAKTGNVMDSSYVWVLNTSGEYINSVEIPFYEQSYTENGRKTTEELMYSMTGVMRGGRILLSAPQDGGYALLALHGREQKRAFINVENDELQYNYLTVSEEGILLGILATEWEAKIVWWRLDAIVGGALN